MFHVLQRRQVVEPPPRLRRRYATVVVAHAGAETRDMRHPAAFLTTPLLMIAGSALAIGLLLEVLLPGGASRPRLPVNAMTASVMSGAVPELHPVSIVHTSVPANVHPFHPARLGVVRFTVRTAGAHVTVRRADQAEGRDLPVTDRSIMLPPGKWVANASAPGFRNWTTYFSVKPSAPTNLFIRLRPARNEASRKLSSKKRAHTRHLS